MNRLNLMKMVNKNIYNHEIKFFNTTEIDLKDDFDSEKYNRKIEIDRKQNITARVNQIMAQVHNQLNMNSRKPSLPKPAIKAEKLKDKSPERVQKSSKKRKAVTLNEEQNKCNNSLVVDNPVSKEMISIYCRKKQKCVQKTSTPPPQPPPPPPPNNVNSKKRIEDMLQHNATLENMLEEHKQLRQDRQSIAHEIIAMRCSLDNIRGRLNSSIKKLDDNKTYCELHGLLCCKSCKK